MALELQTMSLRLLRALFGFAWLWALSAAGHAQELLSVEQQPAELLQAETGTPAGRLRIGLVLGGGGARGAAHIGVLKELERLRVPIDAIVGTSMGAIVGGLYASGMSVAELEETVTTLDWAAALSDQPKRKDMNFRRKQDDAKFPVNFEVGYRDGELALPQGVIQGHHLGLILRKLTLHASEIHDFDKLSTPFRAIASDIVAGEPVTLGEGDLALAIRASMSVPAAFAPVFVDGRLLVDGGLTGNLAVNVMQDMNVDVIIAVDVEFPLYKMDELDSAIAISEQVFTLLIRQETRRQIERLGPQDILITPELGTFGSTDFQRAVETFEPGAAATRAVADRLQELSVDANEYAQYLAERTGAALPVGDLAFVRVVHDAKVAPEILAARMKVEVGDPIDPDVLAAEADLLFGLQLFEKVGYRLVDEGEETGVEFTARSKRWGPNFLRFGVLLEDDFEGSTAFNLTARWRRAELNSLGAELLTDVQLGTDPLISTELYQPLRFHSRVFVAPSLTVRQTNQNAFIMDDAAARLRISEALLQLDVGIEISRVGEFRVGAYRGTGEARVKVGDPSIPNADFDAGGVLTRLRFDAFDNAQFPKHGFRSTLQWNSSQPSLGADTSFDTLEFDLSAALSRGKNTLVFGMDYATALDSLSPVQNYFPLGGFLRLSGLERGQISGPHAALLRLVYYRQVSNSGGGLLHVPVYVGASLESGNSWQIRDDISFDSMLINGSVFLGLDTLIGPVYLAVGFAEGGRSNFYLFVGATPR